jgi:hypothetical protein
MTASFVIANTLTAAANAIILQYTSPIWVFLLSPLILQERPARAEGLALLVSMAGVAVIFSGSPDTSPIGLLVALTSGAGYGTLTVLLRRLRRVNPAVVAALNAFGSGVLLLVPVAVWGGFSLTACASRCSLHFRACCSSALQRRGPRAILLLKPCSPDLDVPRRANPAAGDPGRRAIFGVWSRSDWPGVAGVRPR